MKLALQVLSFVSATVIGVNAHHQHDNPSARFDDVERVARALDRAADLINLGVTAVVAAEHLITSTRGVAGKRWRFTYADETVVAIDVDVRPSLDEAIETAAGLRGSSCDAITLHMGSLLESMCLDYGTARELVLLHGRITRIELCDERAIVPTCVGAKSIPLAIPATHCTRYALCLDSVISIVSTGE